MFTSPLFSRSSRDSSLADTRHTQEQELFVGLPQPRICLSHLLLELLKYLLFLLSVTTPKALQ